MVPTFFVRSTVEHLLDESDYWRDETEVEARSLLEITTRLFFCLKKPVTTNCVCTYFRSLGARSPSLSFSHMYQFENLFAPVKIKNRIRYIVVHLN